MKNFTNNFKQFTSRLSARWLIMALMMLVGTSSAWASTVYFINSLSWTDIKIYYWGNVSVDWGNSPSMTKENYQINGSDVYKYTFNTDPQNVIFRGKDVQTVDIAFSAGEQWTPNNQWDNGKAKGSWSTYTPPCTKSVSNGTGNYNNGEITLSATYNTCGNAYIGFQWKKKDDEWCYTNDGTEKCYKALDSQNKSNEVVETSFTTLNGNLLSGTYVFRPYIVDGSNATNWIYGDEFEVITCSDPSAGYSISNENASVDWDGTEKEVIITTANGYATPSKIYYDGNETKPTAAGEYTITIDVPLNGTYCAATDLEIGTFTITCPTIAAPDITTSATVCAGTQVTLSNYNGVNDNTVNVKWYSSQEFNSEVTEQVILTDDGTKYYAKAYNEASGCYSSEYSTLTFKVNPLPIINISGSEEAVLYEDVTLTATGSDIDEVNWTITSGPGTLSNTTGTSVKLTSSTAGTVKVKATATSEKGCIEESNELSVVFSAENCTPVTSKDIKITFKTPSNNGNNGQYWGIGSLYYKKDNGASYTEVKLYENDNCQGGEQTSQEVTISNLQNNATVYFKACYDYGGYTATTKKLTLTKGNKYIIGIISNQNPSSTNNTNKTSEVGIEVTSEVSLTQDPPIIAPAVKMISAEYDEENDVIVAKGAVYKTGCGETFWGFQYSEDGQTWGTTNEYFIRPNTGNSLSVPGEFEHSFTIPDANGGETYYIRAYALNNYNNDNYSLSSAVYSTTSLPVEIPSKTINSATISLVDIEGNPLDVTEVCPQSTVYLKVSYDGGDFTDFVAEENFPGTDLELVNHDKTNNYAIFSFTATAAGTANITISNKSGSTITPANGVSITLKDVQVVTPPIITINPESAMICQGDDATISIVEENQNYTYTIYKDGEALNPQSFTITEAGVYTVGATENECNTSATSMPIELKVVSSDVKIGLEADNTAIGPWQPLKLTVTPAKGYEYTLEGLDGMVYTKEGDVYTIKIPRPNDWSPGNSGTQLELEKEDKVFTAKIKVSDEVSCGSKEVTVTLTDTEENCE